MRLSIVFTIIVIVVFNIHADILKIDKIIVGKNDVIYKEHPKVYKEGFKKFIPSFNPKSDLLGLERIKEWALPKKSLENKTIRILALRVEFVPDCDSASTGNGLFDLRDTLQFLYEEGHEIDRAPHNKTYFSNHLEALKRYYHYVSDGKLNLTYKVFPEEENRAYKLNHKMKYYGQRGPFASWNESLTAFVNDVILLVDTTDEKVKFSDYDVVIIFHAGSDWQSDMAGLQNSPDDLPGVNVFLGEYIPVNNGKTTVKSAMVIPETTSQDNRIGALNGLLAHEFGHQLGLMDLYSTNDFRTFVGDFALMDGGNIISVQIGGKIVSGALPCYPCAFSRAFLGFNDVITLEEPIENVIVNACEIFGADKKIYKIPISPHEYYLIENRKTNPTGQDIALWLKNGVIAGPVDLNKNFNSAYDYLLPGSGILIWHVDENIANLDYIPDDGIINNWYANTLQWDVYHPFIKLEEADGSRDIGIFLNETGTKFDLFYQGNNDHFGISTLPASISNYGLPTGIDIYGISDTGNTMTFNVNFLKIMPSYMKKFDDPQIPFIFNYQSDINNDGLVDLIPVDSMGNFYVFVNKGNLKFSAINENTDSTGFVFNVNFKYLPPMGKFLDNISDYLFFYNNDGVIFYKLNTENKLNKLAGDEFNKGPSIAYYDSSLQKFKFFYSNGDDTLCYLYGNRVSKLAINAGQILNLNLNTVTKDIILTTEYGKLVKVSPPYKKAHMIGLMGNSLPVGKPLICDINKDGIIDYIIADMTGRIHVIDDEEYYLEGFPYSTGSKILSSPIYFDIDKDGYYEIIVQAEDELHCINYNGTEKTNFPYRFQYSDFLSNITGSPIIYDINNDGNYEILSANVSGRFLSINSEGRLLKDYSFVIDNRCYYSPVISDLNKDGKAEITITNLAGAVMVLPFDNANFSNMWPMFNYSYNFIVPLNSTIIQDGNKLSSQDFINEKTVHNFPNPVRNGFTKIYYYLYDVADVVIEIFDYSGKRLKMLKGTSYPMSENIVPIDVSEFEPDIYLCKLTARKDGKEKIILFKMAIIK